MTKNEIANKEILIDEVIAHLRHFVNLYGIKSIFVVGGYCRAVAMKRRWEVNDIDVASAYHEQAVQLGGLFASEELNTLPQFYHRTGTAAIEYVSELGKIKIEFQGQSVQSYMYNQDIRDYLHTASVEDVPLMSNIHGRDFTINTMLYSPMDDQIYDPLNRAMPDLRRKRIVAVLPPDLLIKYNPLAILRAIRFAVTYDFFIDADLRHEMTKNVDLLAQTITHERIIQEIVQILKIDAVKALDMLKRFKLGKLMIGEEIGRFLELGDKP
jgi:tRNA nucleotidyltransferase/poly(A) polymerase